MRNKTFRKSIITICCLIFTCCLSGLQAQKEMKEGNRLIKKGEYHKALLAYKKVEQKISDEDSNIQAQYLSKIAECYLRLNYYSLALSYFEKAAEYDAEYVNTLNSYIETLKTNGRYEQALDLFYQRLTSDHVKELDSLDLANEMTAYSFPHQNSAENKLATTVPQNSIITLGKKRGLAVINNKLYYSTTGYSVIPDQKDYPDKITEYTLFSADIMDGNIANSIVEKELMDMESNIVYMCIHPTTNNLFFTVLTSDNEEYLYESELVEGKWERANKVKVGKKAIPVSHPVFSDDGNTMIFSSNISSGIGGYDLWLSKLTEKGWGEPKNLGNGINTKGDEICPFLYKGSLFFSSNGQTESYGGFDIYCANQENTTTSIEVENIKQPYNSYADDFYFVIAGESSKGFLVSNRDYTSTDDKIYSFSEIPHFTIVKGSVFDNYNNALPDATVIVKENGSAVYTTKTDSDGNYRAYLKNNRNYTMEVSKANYLSNQENLFTQTDKVIGNAEIDLRTNLDGFELNKAYKMDNLFFHTASCELTTERESLSKIETFMKENPHLNLYFYIFGYLTPDDKFNNLINQQRCDAITNHFIERSVNENRIKYRKYSNEIPTNFGKVNLKKDISYLLYFLFVPKGTDAIKANTTSR